MDTNQLIAFHQAARPDLPADVIEAAIPKAIDAVYAVREGHGATDATMHDAGAAAAIAALVAAAEARAPVARPADDDVVIQLRVRAANLPQLEAGATLGVDALTHQPIEVRLVRREDGVHELECVTGVMAYVATPEPVAGEQLGRSASPTDSGGAG